MSVTAEVLAQFHPFSQLGPEYTDRIVKSAEVHTVAKGKIVFQRGKNLAKLFYLLEGDIKLVDASFQAAEINHQDEAARFALNELNPSKSSAVAATAVQVLAIDRRQLDLVMAANEVGSELPVEDKPDTVSMVSAQINYLDAYAYPQHVELDTVSQDWMSRLLDAPLFNSVPAGNIQQLFTRFEALEIGQGTAIVEEGQDGDYFYVIASGRAKVVSSLGDTVILESGDYFGEEALVGDTTRNATVVMECDGIVERLAKDDFVELLQEPLFRYVKWDQLDDFGPQLQILDVRLPVEHKHFRVQGSRNIALGKLRASLPNLDPGLTYVVTDDGGSRSKVAVQLLLQKGLSAVILSNSEQVYL